MTPLDPQAGSTPAGPPRGLIVGIVIGLVFVALEFGAAFAWAQQHGRNLRKGWNLVPVVTAARDLPEGSVADVSAFVQRSVPEQFVTASTVKPDSISYVVGQKVIVPVQAGDTIRWTDFESAKASTEVLFATRDLDRGAVVTAGDFAPRKFPNELLTDRWVRSSDLPNLSGKKLSVPFRKGDPALWTHFLK